MMKSWKTTTAGIAAIVAVIAAAVAAEFDGDATTIADWGLVVGSLIAGIGLLFARDNKTSDSEAGAK